MLYRAAGGAISCCKRRITPACRCRMCLENGSTCPRAHTRSSLISAKVRVRVLRPPSILPSHPSLPVLASFLCRTSDIVPSLYVFAGKGVSWVGCGRSSARGSLAGGVLTFLLRTGLELVTQGLARATSHRVLAPAAGTSPRYSIPFFQNIKQDLRLSEHVLQCLFFPSPFKYCIYFFCFSHFLVHVD